MTRMKSSALDALVYSKNLDSKHYKENKLGTYVYDGEPSLFARGSFELKCKLSDLKANLKSTPNQCEGL